MEAKSQLPDVCTRLARHLAAPTRCGCPQERGSFHNDINPRHVLLQPSQQGGRRRYMLIDYGGAACPRLTNDLIEAQICPHAEPGAPVLDMRPSVQDPLCGSMQSLWGSSGRLLSQGSDLQSLVFTLVLLAGGHLPWEAAAEAGVPQPAGSNEANGFRVQKDLSGLRFYARFAKKL